MNDDALDRLTRLASSQHGAFRTAQARALGVGARVIAARVSTGEWRYAHWGVVVLCGQPATWHTDVMAATLARPAAAASHRAASRLHRLDGFDVAPIEILVGANRRARLDGVVVHRSVHLDDVDLVNMAGIPTTSLVRTVCDLGAVVDVDRLERAYDSALRAGLVEADVLAALDRLDRPGASGTAALRRVLGLPHRAGTVPDSWFERLAERLVRSTALPPVERQVAVRVRGRVVARFDLAIPAVKVGIEAHSDAWHFGPRRGERDRRRDRVLAGEGWERVYLSWHEVKDACEAEAALVRICRLRARMFGLDPHTFAPVPLPAPAPLRE